MAKLIQPTGEITDVFPANGKTFVLEELQKFVGGYIELVQLIAPILDKGRFHTERFIMYVNEDGIAKDLPPNPTASSMYRSTHGGGRILGPAIVGTVLEMSGDEDDE